MGILHFTYYFLSPSFSLFLLPILSLPFLLSHPPSPLPYLSLSLSLSLPLSLSLSLSLSFSLSLSLPCLILVHKCNKDSYFLPFRNKMQKNSSIHNYHTRSNNSLRPLPSKLKLFQKSYLCVSIKLWNAVGDDVRELNSIFTFK